MGRISNISFKGVYTIKFPKNMSDENIQNRYKKLNQHINDNHLFFIDAKCRENVKSSDENHSETDILMLTSVDNSYLIYETLNIIDKDLGNQYLEKTNVCLDVKA